MTAPDLGAGQALHINSQESASSVPRLSPGTSAADFTTTLARGLKGRLSKRNKDRRLSASGPTSSSGAGQHPRVTKRAHGLATVQESRPLPTELYSTNKPYPPTSDTTKAAKKPSVPLKSACPRLERFSWQSGGPPPKRFELKTRHIEIKPSGNLTPPSTVSSPRSHKGPSSGLQTPPTQVSPRSTSTSKQPARPTLPHFTFPNPGLKTLPPSPPLTSWDNAHAPLSLQRPCTPPIGKGRIRILPDTPESLRPPVTLRDSTNDGIMASNGITSPSSSANIAGLAQQVSAPGQSGNSLSSLVCNVNRTSGERPPPLVGASSTIVGDKLYVFGGRRLSRSKPHLTSALYEIDLITRHWRRLRTGGSKPAPRYFHSMNSLGDTKLVCFGGMASADDVTDASLSRTDSGMVLLNDLYMYDIASRSWTPFECTDAPRGRYAHCAVVLPSTTSPTSDSSQTSSATGHTPNSSQSGINNDGKGGAQLIIIGGQTPENKYVMEINVFNFRSRKWERSDPLTKEYGAYRSVAIPLTSVTPSQIGSASPDGPTSPESESKDDEDDPNSTLIYSNYNFLDVKLEFCLRTADGSLNERSMKGAFSPPGLRFPNGDVHADHFILSGTFLTSTRKEYALWALDLKALTWQRIDVGPGILTSGSWNRGLLWKKRNMYVVFGDRRRKLDQDYNHRRLNFANMMTVELEAYGLYANPVTTLPGAKYVSASSPFGVPTISPLADRPLNSDAGMSLGRAVLGENELCDMDFLAIGGDRISVNSQVIARRWGPYLVHLLEGSSNPAASAPNGTSSDEGASGPNGRPLTIASMVSRASSVTITPGSVGSSTLGGGSTSSFAMGMNSAINNIMPSNLSARSTVSTTTGADPAFGSTQMLPAGLRPRVLYLPHTAPTIRALVHYLYTWSLPEHDNPLCTAQILCSLLQIARPYRVDGLLEAVVERLHEVLDARNTAAVFNAAAMAAGGGDAVVFTGALAPLSNRERLGARKVIEETALAEGGSDAEESEGGSQSSSSADLSGTSENTDNKRDEIWTGELSSVVGLQKRGLRGLMEGRKLREQGGASGEGDGMAAPSSGV